MESIADHRSRQYAHQGSHRVGFIFSQIVGLFGILYFTVVCAFSVLIGGFMFFQAAAGRVHFSLDVRVVTVLGGAWTLACGWFAGSMIMNAQPNFWAVESGIYISVFAFFRILIPWSGIVNIIEDKPRKGYALVRARKITVFHRLIGWSYSRKFVPSILIGPGIENREELIRIIRRRSINGIIPPAG